jgi:hypothetical protein
MTDTLNQLPVGHAVHVEAPARLYCPAGQTDAVTLAEPAGQAWPAAQGRKVALVDPAGHAYPATQVPLQACNRMPLVLPNLPA